MNLGRESEAKEAPERLCLSSAQRLEDFVQEWLLHRVWPVQYAVRALPHPEGVKWASKVMILLATGAQEDLLGTGGSYLGPFGHRLAETR